jgi:hypothetical protein
LCEEWFQQRLRELETPKPVNLLPHGKWKHCLKMERNCPLLVEATERLAAQILETLRP